MLALSALLASLLAPATQAYDGLPLIDQLECAATNGVTISTEISARRGLEALVKTKWGFASKFFRASLQTGHNGASIIALLSDEADYEIALNLNLADREVQTAEGQLLRSNKVFPELPTLLARIRCDITLK